MKYLRPICLLSLLFFSVLEGEEKGSEAVESKADVEITTGTGAYDEEAVRELYRQYKKQNEEREKREVVIGDMDTFILDDFQVDSDDLGRDGRRILESLDPQPRNRINRIARVNPEAAAEIQHAMRSDEVFFSKESLADSGASIGDAGQTADFTVKQISDALSKIGNLFGGKKEEPPEDVR